MKKAIVSVFLCVSLGLGAAQAQLKIDFNVTGGVVAAGYQGYFATDKTPAAFTAQSYTAFGTTVTIKPTWVAGAAAGGIRMIDRGNNTTIENSDLLRDWIGTDTRTVPADPMTLTISGLPAGTYQWVSYHHDLNDQTGIFSVTVNDAAGSKTTTGIDISNGANFKLADVTKFTTTIVSNGKNDVSLVFHQTSASSVVANAIFVMNGFDLTAMVTETAQGPVPAVAATDVRRDGTILSWTPSSKAIAHDVYLGTSFDAIDGGTTAGAVYKGRQDANSYNPGRLALGQTYYWRVDEVQAGNTVSKGSIWSFTVEPLGIPIAGASITATASSSNSLAEGPGKTVDGSGLSADGLHGTDTATMWLSAPTDPGPVWIQYQFDKLYKLHQMLVWNHNTNVEPIVGFGAKSVTIDYSVDGTTWTTLGAAVQIAQATGSSSYAANTTVDFGDVVAKYVRIKIASNWGGLLKQYGLSEVRFLAIPETARQPVPAAGATAVDPRSVLSWRGGREAAKHQVYVSTDANQVRNGTAPVSTVSGASFDAGGVLQLGKTYYWKVNEVNDLAKPPTWEGDIWSFSTAAILTVDDMESYNDADGKGTRIYETWVDGFGTKTNGSQVGYDNAPFAERAVFHGGTQSMPLRYDNSTAGYSEATRTFSSPQDWTLFGVKGLTLWFYGNSANTAATMYVKVNGHKVAYDGDAGNILSKPWHIWYVDLSALTGVNLKKVTDLTIGFEGGKGIVLFDDIALTPAGRQLVTPMKPAATNLVAHYLFDGNVNDATGAHPGVVVGAPQYIAGKVGQAVKFDGARDYVASEGTYSLSSYTVALWFRVDGGTGARDLFSLYDELAVGGHGILLEVLDPATVRFLHRSPVSATAGGTNVYSTSTHGDGAWYHLAAVKSATTMSLYINGELAGSAADTTVFDKALARMAVGVLKVDNLTRYLPGAVDDLYLYGRDLSQAEIASLAGRTQPFDKP
jgi:hypothetical protein